METLIDPVISRNPYRFLSLINGALIDPLTRSLIDPFIGTLNPPPETHEMLQKFSCCLPAIGDLRGGLRVCGLGSWVLGLGLRR